MYRYSLSGATWTTLAPTTARAGAPIAGMGANWVAKTGDAVWADENNIRDGRRIVSFRGGSSIQDQYDIAGGTNGAGAWQAITYIGATETFSTGSSYDNVGGKIFIRKDSTHRYFSYDVVGNYIYPFSTLPYPDSTAVLGDKLFSVRYTDGATAIDFLYSITNSSSIMHRTVIY